MAVVFNRIMEAGEREPMSDVRVSVSLSWDTDLGEIIRDFDDEVVFLGPVKTRTLLNGVWELELSPNSEFIPAGSVYKAVESSADGVVLASYFFVVPDAATPNFWVGDLVVGTPVWEV